MIPANAVVEDRAEKGTAMTLHETLGFSWDRPDLPQDEPNSITRVVFRYITELVTFVFEAAALEGNRMNQDEIKALGACAAETARIE